MLFLVPPPRGPPAPPCGGPEPRKVRTLAGWAVRRPVGPYAGLLLVPKLMGPTPARWAVRWPWWSVRWPVGPYAGPGGPYAGPGGPYPPNHRQTTLGVVGGLSGGNLNQCSAKIAQEPKDMKS